MRNLLIAPKRTYPNGSKGSKERSARPKKGARLSTVNKIGRISAMKTMARIDTALPLGFDETAILVGERTPKFGHKGETALNRRKKARGALRSAGSRISDPGCRP